MYANLDIAKAYFQELKPQIGWFVTRIN